ncbi:MAG: glycosyltransferase family 4 protein [Fibrobacteria bacterium]|nr:glycosyltransferase family 4 protein [Fibrobacteria bacterium]
MKVLHLVSVYPRRQDDPEVPWLRTMLHHLSERGHESLVLAPAWRGLRSHGIDGIAVHRFRYAPASLEILTGEEGAPNKIARRPWMQLLAVPYILCGAWRAFQICRRERPDLLHVHWPFPHALCALPAAWLLGIPVVTHFYLAELLLRRKFPFVTPFLSLAVAMSRKVVAISRYTAGQVRSIRATDIAVIPYGGASTPSEAPPPPPEGRPVILFVGRHVERKGIPTLLQAMEHLRTEADLVVCGHGDQTESLKVLARRSPAAARITFPGRVDAEQLSALYARCSVFCLPSVIDSRGDTEGLGTVPLEAYAHGKPVVCSDVGGIPDVVEDGRSGLLVPPGDAVALAEALDRILGNPELARSMGSYGQELIRGRFSWPRLAEEIEGVWLDATRDPGSV